MRTLKKQVGPLPLWGWLAAVALGAVIFYWQRNNAGGQVVTGRTTPETHFLDPTEGAIPNAPGLSSGGTAPETIGWTPTDYASAVTQELLPVLMTLPYAGVPSEPQNPSVGSSNVDSFVTTFTALREVGFTFGAAPPASTGSATSQAQSHAKPKTPVKRVRNTQRGNPRRGQTYRVVTNPQGKPKGVYHVYDRGKYAKKPKWVRVKK